ncbi:hypothetical protein P43SY_001668 [Pythium insidiosum]|uniref:Uncharacterized protein n=1 Tax=Pythium insidiosum TaxID=114742 RepID=A0AAD5LYE5_PYTIN|nr:hypothetical protein P43SY_001668 [Pythium insidiosum]
MSLSVAPVRVDGSQYSVVAYPKNPLPSCAKEKYDLCGDAETGPTCCPAGSYCEPKSPYVFQCSTPPPKCVLQEAGYELVSQASHDVPVLVNAKNNNVRHKPRFSSLTQQAASRFSVSLTFSCDWTAWRAADFSSMSRLPPQASSELALPSRSFGRELSSTSRRRARPDLRLDLLQSSTLDARLPRSLFRLLWVVIVAIHATCTAYPLCIASLYVLLPTKAPTLLSAIELYSLSVDSRSYPAIACAYVAIAIVHAVQLGRILALSLSHRQLLFVSPTQASTKSWTARLQGLLRRRWATRRSRKIAVLPRASERVSSVRLSSSQIINYSLTALNSAKALASASDATDRNFDTAFVVRELVETGFLSFQLYTSSFRVARVWMNNLLVTLLVLNCWTMPLAQRLFHVAVARARLLALVVNLSLDLCMYVVIPVLLFKPYFDDYDPAVRDMPLRLWYTDRWLVRMISEWPVLFVSSTWDGVSKAFVVVRIARSLENIPKLVPTTSTAATAATATATPATAVSPAAPPRPSNRWSLLHQQWGELQSTQSLRRRLQMLFERSGRVLLALWGLVVLGLHLHAASFEDARDCVVPVRPWIATRAACSLVQLNCRAHPSLTGAASDFDRALATVDCRWVAYLIIRHCPRVEITPRVQELPNLMGLKIYNSTLARWDADAALTQQHHPNALFVFLVATNMTQLPPALYDPAFPRKLGDIEVVHSNLSTLPLEIVERWPENLFLAFEGVQFSVVPAALPRLRPYFLSLAMAPVREIPAELFESDVLNSVVLNGCPIDALPAQVAPVPRLIRLYLDATNVSDLPSWVELKPELAIRASGTPLCERTETDLDPADPHDLELQRYVRCAPLPGDPFDLYFFPVAQEPLYNP